MNRQKFLKSLPALTSWRENAFILAMAERALPNALLFFENKEHMPVDLSMYSNGLLAVMDATWKELIREPNEEGLIDLLDVVADCFPDIEQEDSYGVLPTGDCLWLWEQALIGGINQDKKRALEASQRSLETVTQFLEFSEGEGLSEDQVIKLFDSHALVKREFSFQEELSERLRSAKSPSEVFINDIRAISQDDGVSNIGISLN